VNAPIIKPLFSRSFWKKDFPSVGSRRAVRPHPHPLDPALALASDVKPPVTVRRLGVLSSIKSAWFASLSTRGRNWTRPGGSAESRGGVDTEAGKAMEIQEMEMVWVAKGHDGTTMPYSPYDVRDGPRPLLPEPTHSWSSRGDKSLRWNGLDSIDEEGSGGSSRRM
jgi:hypothetical protein